MAVNITVGNVTITVVTDTVPPPRDPESFFPDVPLEKWEPYKAKHLDTDGKFRMDFCAAVICSPERTVLVDTGLGPGPHERYGGIRGHLLDRLREIGVKPEDIPFVVFTHLHLDHIGWNVSQEGGRKKATFPRAKYLIPKGDWDYFTQPEILQSQPEVQEQVVPLEALGVMELTEGDIEVTPEITTLSTPGHTPGHRAVVVSSQGEKAVFVGDVFHSAVQVTEQDWSPWPDVVKELACRSRNDLLDRLEHEGCPAVAWHIPGASGIGKVVRIGGQRIWQPL